MHKMVEAQMQGAACRHRDPVGTDRIAVGEENSERDMRVAAAGIEKASGLVRNEGAVGKRTSRRDMTFGDRPTGAPMASI